MNLDPMTFKQAMDNATVKENDMVDETTPEPTIPSVDDAVDFRIAAMLAPVLAEIEAGKVVEGFEANVIEVIEDYDFDSMITDAIDNWATYELDFDSKVSDALQYNFDPSDYDLLTQDSFDPDYWDLVTDDKLEEEIGGLASRIDELEPIADSMDRISDELSVLKETVEGGPASGDNAADADVVQQSIDGLQDEINDIKSSLAEVIETIQEFGANL